MITFDKLKMVFTSKWHTLWVPTPHHPAPAADSDRVVTKQYGSTTTKLTVSDVKGAK